MKKNTYHQSHLIKELAETTKLPQTKIKTILEALRTITSREALKEGLTLPGLCRFDVVRRKPRKVRNPKTGQILLIGEHLSLRVRVVKKLRTEVTPLPEMVIIETPVLTPEMEDFSQAVSFKCKACGQEIEAPLSTAGLLAECPNCQAAITIPSISEPGTLHGGSVPEVASTSPQTTTTQSNQMASSQLVDKNRTIRIDLAALGMESHEPQKPVEKRAVSFICKSCQQEIEAPCEMAGNTADCPSCGMTFEVPFFSEEGTIHAVATDKQTSDLVKAMKSRTIRIEVPDDI
jgi:nucleoid DNA-binding protein/Zn finger protein HypA/HybF involved in hydrogenase expression